MFDTLRQIDAGALNVGYVEVGPATGPVVIHLHGWPYDIHSFLEAAPLLTAKGFRVIIPHLRGYGTTRFRSPEFEPASIPGAATTVQIIVKDSKRYASASTGGRDSAGSSMANPLTKLSMRPALPVMRLA